MLSRAQYNETQKLLEKRRKTGKFVPSLWKSQIIKRTRLRQSYCIFSRLLLRADEFE